MGFGVWLHLPEQHEHEHQHEALTATGIATARIISTSTASPLTS